MKRRIRENAWGNWYGYEGSKRVREFANSAVGSAEEMAQEWQRGEEGKPDSLHGLSTQIGASLTDQLERRATTE